ncbi:ABC transporter ATP-binding protein [Rhizobium ruizarguesonis]|nr:ABC transporter ATP-binding protein [Rhizobium ruizarguesonis]
MNDIVISVENVSKLYRLGAINHGTLYRDLQSWWARLRGKADPNSPIDTPRSNSAVQSEQWFKALDGIDFEVTRGEVLGLIGGNGAGKSTLLKILSRITAPSSGEVRMKGRIASLLEVGTGFHPELTGRENVFLNGALLGMAPTEVSKKFDEIVDFAGVETFIDTPVKRYSSGMYVRLAFAVAAHLESEVLLVDEVLAVGDTAFQKKCLGKMEDIGASGRTILFVSHNMAAIENLCQKVLVLDRGRSISLVTRRVASSTTTQRSIRMSSDI